MFEDIVLFCIFVDYISHSFGMVFRIQKETSI